MVQLNTEIFKVPLGFIKIIELLFAIIAFATVSGWGVSTTYRSKAQGCATVPVAFGYPFNFPSTTAGVIPLNSCVKTSTAAPDQVLVHESYKSTGEFFVFTGVMTMLYVLAATAVYLVLWNKYESDNRYPIVDLIVTCILAVFWLFGAIAWAFATGGIKSLTNEDTLLASLAKLDSGCQIAKDPCAFSTTWSYGRLTIGALAGAVCALCFAFNVWFVYKETVWWRNRTPTSPPMGAGPRVPDGPSVA